MIKRYRTTDEAARDLWVDPSDPALPNRIEALWRRATVLSPPMIPRGLRLFRSLEDAAAERKSWTAERIKAMKNPGSTDGPRADPPDDTA